MQRKYHLPTLVGPRPSWKTGCAAGASLLTIATLSIAQPAQALTIKPVFDKSITSLANAQVIESAFNTVAAQFGRALGAHATIYINVSMGSVGGRALPGGTIGASLDNLYNGFSYTDLTGYLKADAAANLRDTNLVKAMANLPRNDPTGLDNFVVPYAEGKVLGFLDPNRHQVDGYIGFRNVAYDFNSSNGVATGTYDFQGLAAHEIGEVLGRITGLQGTISWATPLDLFRYTAAHVSSFSSGAHAYFSIDGGVTKRAAWNYASRGDRTDWLTSALSSDAQQAYLNTGKAYAMSAADWIQLDALGWNGMYNPGGQGPQPTTAPFYSDGSSVGVPEPATWAMLMMGAGAAGVSLRRQRPKRLRQAI